MSFLRSVSILLMIALVSACVSMPSAEQGAPTVQFTTNKKIAVGVVDNRSYVVNGDKKNYYEGYSRDLWAIPHDMPTMGKVPMADMLLERINIGLTRQNIKTVVLPGLSASNLKDAVALKGLADKNDSEKILSIVLNEWKSERKSVTNNLNFIYDVDVNVFDKQGQLIDRKNFKGIDAREGSLINMYEENSNCFKAKLEEIINDLSITKALQG